MDKITLSNQEICTIRSVLNDVTSQYDSVEDSNLLKDACIFAHDLPRRVRKFLNDFRSLEQSGVCIISGYPIEDSKIGRTPNHWRGKPAVSPALEEEILLVLYGSLLGDVFGWATQQGGHIVHDVFPIREHEDQQLGTGSEQLLWWHNEDAFHPYRGDYLGLMCLRNPDEVATTYASISMIQLEHKQIEILCEPRFIIRPDESHLEKNGPGLQERPWDSEGLIESAYRRINRMNSSPQKVPVLSGDPQSPYLRIDSYFMDDLGDDEEAVDALNALIGSIDASLSDLILRPGDYCFIDNYKAVHGRKSFKAKYDGNDRWLKRINITRDLRKSRDARASSTSRVIL